MKRPKLISFICIVGYLSVLLAFPQVFSPQVKKLGVLMPALYGILVAAHFIACVGIWYLKQWGAQLFVIAFFARLLFNLSINDTGPGFYVNTGLNFIFILLLLRFYPRMDRNL